MPVGIRRPRTHIKLVEPCLVCMVYMTPVAVSPFDKTKTRIMTEWCLLTGIDAKSFNSKK